ncbi:diguanylate phosphodiesterase [Arthrobacter sp. Hiyo6]|nr:diguanylate phosphodiesterase [Arthrobacter sp. Hiyo6]
MSMDETSFPALTDGELTAEWGTQSIPPSDVSSPAIRGQAWDIIESVLDDPSPQSEWARERLRTAWPRIRDAPSARCSNT